MSTLAIAACSKNEGTTIFEWAIFHKLVGVDQIFIYDEGTDNTKEILQPLIDEGFIAYYRWTEHPGQIEAMQHHQAYNRDKHTYTAFIDTDEYLVPDIFQGNFNVKKVLRQMLDNTGANGLALPWVYIGPKGLLTRNEDKLVISEFDRCMSFQTDRTVHCKMIVRNSVCPKLVSIHNITETGQGVGFIQMDKSPYRGFNHPGYSYVYGGLFLCHYWGKSKKEYIEYKLKRGFNYPGTVYTENQWNEYNSWTNDVPFPAAKLYATAVSEIMNLYGRYKSA